MVKVKVCGIKTIEHAEAAVKAGADAIGFIFAESRRKVSIHTAKEISDTIPASVLKVGVFVDADREEIEKTAQEANLDYVQLHGSETVDFMKSLSVPAYKALSIKEKKDLDGIENYPGNFILVDSGHGAARGGNGTTFDWSYLENVSIDVILAGGLNLENVCSAIEKVNPFMVDVSSGVETDGIKDVKKINEFIFKVKNISRMKEEVQ
ncbi:phosphoribosylanthranilate isomerase [Bacillus sp. SG-1]|uniref:phosphoribosylanthranilate isomerase n=1 Tax=Bacillus sp. SG-1 TaxID=161544 RepID=UPI00015439F5|nr:phosphoribosylanthranilate isomerase [Bacillus sp. SG-1]EDL66153.1 N-(5'-phosphoribosyl)anthranilate isomerase [Bacillus sp. SG-1]